MEILTIMTIKHLSTLSTKIIINLKSAFRRIAMSMMLGNISPEKLQSYSVMYFSTKSLSGSMLFELLKSKLLKFPATMIIMFDALCSKCGKNVDTKPCCVGNDCTEEWDENYEDFEVAKITPSTVYFDFVKGWLKRNQRIWKAFKT